MTENKARWWEEKVEIDACLEPYTLSLVPADFVGVAFTGEVWVALRDFKDRHSGTWASDWRTITVEQVQEYLASRRKELETLESLAEVRK